MGLFPSNFVTNNLNAEPEPGRSSPETTLLSATGKRAKRSAAGALKLGQISDASQPGSQRTHTSSPFPSAVAYVEKAATPEETSLEARVEPEPVFIDEVPPTPPNTNEPRGLDFSVSVSFSVSFPQLICC